MDPHKAIALSDHRHGVSSGYETGRTGVSSSHAQREEHEHEHAQSPRADGEKDAQLFLVGGFCLRLCYGVSTAPEISTLPVRCEHNQYLEIFRFTRRFADGSNRLTDSLNAGACIW